MVGGERGRRGCREVVMGRGRWEDGLRVAGERGEG